MMAQPLAWFEATGLTKEAFAIAPLVHTYREYQERIHAGQIFPIGEEPSGTGWTGFQSLRGDEGYLIVYREHNDRSETRLKLWNVAGRMIHCTLIAGPGAGFLGCGGCERRGGVHARPAVLVRAVRVSHQSVGRYTDSTDQHRSKTNLCESAWICVRCFERKDIMDALEAIRKRRTVRSFTRAVIPRCRSGDDRGRRAVSPHPATTASPGISSL